MDGGSLARWWPEIVKTAEGAGYSEQRVKEKLDAGHTLPWPAREGLLLLDCATDGACVVWLGAGRNVRAWQGEVEAEVSTFARAHGCDRIRIEGRKGWRRLLPHWTLAGTDGDTITLELPL